MNDAEQNEIDRINKIRGEDDIKALADTKALAAEWAARKSPAQIEKEALEKSVKPIAQPTEYYIPVQAHVLYRAALREYLNAGRTFDDADALAMQDIWDTSFLRDPDSNILDILELE